MATTVRITETYDMKTTKNKMGVIGIHTPTGEAIRRLYPGLVKSHKFIRFVKCDVVGACASVLPADPLQVGINSGEVAPEDMFNPILYKAVTNTSFDTLVARVTRSTADVAQLMSVSTDNNANGESPNFSTYYSLLAENGEYRKAMPQSGFAIRNLVPLAHTLISSYGNLAPIGNVEVPIAGADNETTFVPEVSDVNTSAPDDFLGNVVTRTPEAVTFRGKSIRMPRFPIHYTVEAWDAIPYLNLVKTMVAVLIVPPARLHEFYYRMRVTWTVRFEEVCSTLTAGNASALSQVANYAYAKNYSYESSKEALDHEESSVDVTDVDITKIMES